MPLLNYTTKVSAEKTASEIISLLSKKGATQVMMEFGDAGQPVGLKWRVDSPRGALGFALPINPEAVHKVLTAERVLVTNDQARKEQALRTAWRIVKEWVAAQMALIETGMVEMEEVFLPYMLSGDRTVECLSRGTLTMSDNHPILPYRPRSAKTPVFDAPPIR